MERGLLWLPLLILFFWLAWAGWNEYQKLEAYKVWAEDFERTKYDILAALGQSGDTLTWGRPTRQGIRGSQTIARSQITSIQIWIKGRSQPLNMDDFASTDPETISGRRSEIRFDLGHTIAPVPFTDAALALQWGQFLQKWLSQPN